jgi:hypothetical protein
MKISTTAPTPPTEKSRRRLERGKNKIAGEKIYYSVHHFDYSGIIAVFLGR